jgi:hypothetical protein
MTTTTGGDVSMTPNAYDILTTTSPVTPIIHLNGDRKETLQNALIDTYHDARRLERALVDTCPNARNYYPEPGRLEQAMLHHQARCMAVRAVMQSLLAEYDALSTTV